MFGGGVAGELLKSTADGSDSRTRWLFLLFVPDADDTGYNKSHESDDTNEQSERDHFALG